MIKKILLLGLCSTSVFATTHYVDLNSTNSVAPYTTWETAANEIRDAVNVCADGDEVLVADGVYSGGVTVSKDIKVESVGGPDISIVHGGFGPCFNLGDNVCVISGFTIENGTGYVEETSGYAGVYGGGVYCSSTAPIVTNCVIQNNEADGSFNNANHGQGRGVGGGMYQGTAIDCTFISNRVITVKTYGGGGGMGFGNAVNCVFIDNQAPAGGGKSYGTATNCTFIENKTSGYFEGGNKGGGFYGGVANNCMFIGNIATERGGGMSGGTANNCTFTDNSAKFGGGMNIGTANGCLFAGNIVSQSGGGMDYGVANNCTFTKNSSLGSGGGMAWGSANNCILWHNIAEIIGGDLHSSTATNCCFPDAVGGINGNITSSPRFSSLGHLAPESPCIGAGNTSYSIGSDIDGEPWLNPPSIGCDEFHGVSSMTGEISVVLHPIGGLTPGEAGLGVSESLSSEIYGAVTRHIWDFGDGTYATNNLYPTHAWNTLGAYTVILTAYNESYPSGISATQTVQVVNNTIYVSETGNNLNDGASWDQAKLTIQAGVDAQLYPKGKVIVGMGTYSGGIKIVRSTVVESAYGAKSTIVNGGSPCFNLGSSDCLVKGFTIQGGSGFRVKRSSSGYRYYGGGVYCTGVRPTVSSCIIRNNTVGNTSEPWGAWGGGMYRGTAKNCVFYGNSARTENWGAYGGGMYGGTAKNCAFYRNSSFDGGGTYGGTLYNCTLTGNHASSDGGGIYSCTAYNSIIWGNNSTDWGDNFYNSTLTNCCSPSLPSGSVGITDDPMLLSNYHIGPDSPCYGIGNAEYVSGVDIDGQSWLNPSSIGCDEYHNIDAQPIYVSKLGDDSNNGETWATAKKTIQAGVDMQLPFGQVIVSNGTYVLDSEVIVEKIISVQSVNGSDYTIVDGNQNGTCFNLWEYECEISGFTIQNGSGHYYGETSLYGGGVYCALNSFLASVSNCIIKSNQADWGGGMWQGTAIDCTFIGNQSTSSGGGKFEGLASNCIFEDNVATNSAGGMFGGTANNCLFRDNAAKNGTNTHATYGGGMANGTANNCTFTGNWSENWAGGMSGGIANNCIVWGNSAGSAYDDSYSTSFNYSCSPELTHGTRGNITNNPEFVRESGDFRLWATSPCINAGDNSYVNSCVDLNGNPRILGTSVDIGAYEYQDMDDDGILDLWEESYFGSITNCAPSDDPDVDRYDNLDEFLLYTHMDPLRWGFYLETIFADEVDMGWRMVNGKNYQVQSSSCLASNSWENVGGVIIGDASADAQFNAPLDAQQKFYRVITLP